MLTSLLVKAVPFVNIRKRTCACAGHRRYRPRSEQRQVCRFRKSVTEHALRTRVMMDSPTKTTTTKPSGSSRATPREHSVNPPKTAPHSHNGLREGEHCRG